MAAESRSDPDKRLFTLFGRLDLGDNRDTAGLGLGLAISARIIAAHGGQISYRANEAGTGTVFSVRLPRGETAAAQSGRTTIAVVEERGHES